MTKNILVTGANGQLGNEIRDIALLYPLYRFVFTGSSELDITNKEAVENIVKQQNINYIINCAAYTAVDKAETEQKQALDVNARATETIASIAKQHNIKLIHISTDYVFDGTNNTPYTETATTNPIGYYGYTKLEGEKAIQQINPSAVIIRTSWLYSSYGNNFVKTMLRVASQRPEVRVVYDQVGSPTYAADLATAIMTIIPNMTEQTTLYHYGNEGAVSWYDFAQAIFQLSGIHTSLKPIRTAEYPTPTSRPAYSVLDKQKIKTDFNITIPHWYDALTRCIKKIQLS